uniref:Claudin n=1 Tax=Sinocyclocheilus grahami TaxID=75366 RepID=A0A672SQI0_SINGR
MPSTGCQILGICLATVGFLGSIVICGLPNWKVSAFIGANIVTSQIIWDGLWMNCVVQSTGQMQCMVYDSLLALPQDQQENKIHDSLGNRPILQHYKCLCCHF